MKICSSKVKWLQTHYLHCNNVPLTIHKSFQKPFCWHGILPRLISSSISVASRLSVSEKLSDILLIMSSSGRVSPMPSLWGEGVYSLTVLLILRTGPRNFWYLSDVGLNDDTEGRSKTWIFLRICFSLLVHLMLAGSLSSSSPPPFEGFLLMEAKMVLGWLVSVCLKVLS